MRLGGIVIVIVGLLALAAGFYGYAQLAGYWQQSQSLLTQMGAAVSPRLRDQIASLRLAYFGSIGAMILGALFMLVGLQVAMLRGRTPESSGR